MKKLLLVLVAFFAFTFSAFAAVDLNTATKEELDSVKYIGPVKAQAIIDYRKKNGPFKSVDDLKNVRGFGDKTVAKVRSDLTVGGASSRSEEKPAKAEEKQVKTDKKADSKREEKAEKKSDAKKEEKSGKKDDVKKDDKADSKADKKKEKAEKKKEKAEKKKEKTEKKEKADKKEDKHAQK